MTDETKGRRSTPASSSPLDEVARKRDFRRAQGIDIHSFMVDAEPDELPQPEKAEVIVEDIAVGEISPLFTSGGEESTVAGAVQRDGTVE